MTTTTATVQVIISLCHAVSDGPGALDVARDFCQRLAAVLDGTATTTKTTEFPSTLPVTDLQVLLLGGDDSAAAGAPKRDVFVGQDEVMRHAGSSTTTITQHVPWPE